MSNKLDPSRLRRMERRRPGDPHTKVVEIAHVIEHLEGLTLWLAHLPTVEWANIRTQSGDVMTIGPISDARRELARWRDALQSFGGRNKGEGA